jgi:2-oxoglutarate ferredoxin oxidoreductase subunit delta
MAFRVKVESFRCKACELCVAACPKKIMILTSEKNDQGFTVAACSSESGCTGCLACALVCPDAAIEIYKEEAE